MITWIGNNQLLVARFISLYYPLFCSIVLFYWFIVSSNTYGNDYDANMIKSEVSLAKQRIEKLKNELIEIEIETKQKEINVNTLDEMNHKVMNDAYSLDEALLIVNELKTIRNTITRGEQERKALIEVWKFIRCYR